MSYHKTFTVYGQAVPKGRARVVRSGGFVRAFTPKKTVDWESSVAGQAIVHKPPQLLTGPIKLGVRFYRAPLKSFSKDKRELAMSGKFRPATRPDLDNLIKGIKDALNGIMWQDDSQVIEYIVGTGKYFGDPPRVEIEVYEI